MTATSTLTVRPDFRPVIEEFFITDDERADKNFEIVYTALETAGDKKFLVVCWRNSNYVRFGMKNPQGIPETITHLSKFDMGSMCSGTLNTES